MLYPSVSQIIYGTRIISVCPHVKALRFSISVHCFKSSLGASYLHWNCGHFTILFPTWRFQPNGKKNSQLKSNWYHYQHHFQRKLAVNVRKKHISSKPVTSHLATVNTCISPSAPHDFLRVSPCLLLIGNFGQLYNIGSQKLTQADHEWIRLIRSSQVFLHSLKNNSH